MAADTPEYEVPAYCYKCNVRLPERTAYFGYDPKWNQTALWIDPEPREKHGEESPRCRGARVRLDTSQLPAEIRSLMARPPGN